MSRAFFFFLFATLTTSEAKSERGLYEIFTKLVLMFAHEQCNVRSIHAGEKSG